MGGVAIRMVVVRNVTFVTKQREISCSNSIVRQNEKKQKWRSRVRQTLRQATFRISVGRVARVCKPHLSLTAALPWICTLVPLNSYRMIYGLLGTEWPNPLENPLAAQLGGIQVRIWPKPWILATDCGKCGGLDSISHGAGEPRASSFTW